jgi:GT2 family glycosyltransferase
MMKPKVSILVLTYNRVPMSSQYIPNLLERAGNIDAELLIWDNASVDTTYDWVKSYKETDPRVTFIAKSKKNIGMEAINYLAKKARGEYILKVDDDIDVPVGFAERLVWAHEKANEPKLLFLGWDMPWPITPRSGGNTFATRSGMRLYKGKLGKVIQLTNKERILVHYHPATWMVNGACRLSRRDQFLEIGGHPEGIVYGVDHHISIRAEEHGYWIGYFSAPVFVYHRGIKDTPEYRCMKDAELRRVKSPKDV